MIFTAMVREVLFNSLQLADARLEGIDDKGTPYTVGASGTTLDRLYLDANWNPPFDIGGANLIITSGTSDGGTKRTEESGGLILPGNGLPYTIIRDLSNVPITSGGNYVFAIPTFVGDTTVLSDYHEYTSASSIITDKRYDLTGASGTDGTYVGVSGVSSSNSYQKGTLISTTYFIHLAVPMLNVIDASTRFIIVLQDETTNSAPSSNAIDLRQYIDNMTWSTSIDKGYDTATIELNESASNLGKYYSYFLGQNVEIIDIYGNICWNGLITSIYIDGGGGRIDAVGYKKTMEWFRFDKIYVPETNWSSTVPGPTSSQVFHDAMLMNPYTRKIFINDGTSNIPRNWAIKGFVYDADGLPTGASWPDSQLSATSYVGLDQLDFSDGSFKCSDAIQTVESFGYAYTNEAGVLFDKDTVYLQFWNDGFARVLRVRKNPRLVMVPDYIITKKNTKNGNRGVEISGDINDIITETFVIYNDAEGGQNVSSSTYNAAMALKYGMRLRIETSDFGPELANLITLAANADKNLVVGIGNVTISGNVKGGGGGMNNLPVYMMRAGRIVEFEDNIGHGSLYRNANGTPGIFYIGSTSFNTSSGELTLTPAVTLSAVDLFITRQSKITN